MKSYTVKTTETFAKNIKRLSRKYRQIKKDLLLILATNLRRDSLQNQAVAQGVASCA